MPPEDGHGPREIRAARVGRPPHRPCRPLHTDAARACSRSVAVAAKARNSCRRVCYCQGCAQRKSVSAQPIQCLDLQRRATPHAYKSTHLPSGDLPDLPHLKQTLSALRSNWSQGAGREHVSTTVPVVLPRKGTGGRVSSSVQNPLGSACLGPGVLHVRERREQGDGPRSTSASVTQTTFRNKRNRCITRTPARSGWEPTSRGGTLLLRIGGNVNL